MYGKIFILEFKVGKNTGDRRHTSMYIHEGSIMTAFEKMLKKTKHCHVDV
jgi:hypothetical protein